MKIHLEFNYDPKGYGNLTAFANDKKLISIPARTGANHFRNQKLTLVNAIPNADYVLMEPPQLTPEKGMFIQSLPGFGWKIRLYKKSTGEHEQDVYKATSYLIHPDGNQPGTLGCIGIQNSNAPHLYQWLQRIIPADAPENKIIPFHIRPISPTMTNHEKIHEPKTAQNEITPTQPDPNPTTLPASKTETAGIAAIILTAINLLGIDMPKNAALQIATIGAAAIGIIHRVYKILSKKGDLS